MKHSWIIGASSGIGAGLARALAARGEVLCLSARSETGLREVLSTLRQEGQEHLVLPMDVSRPQEIERALKQLRESWQRIDRVILMAGIYAPMSFGAMNLAQASNIIDVNIKSAFYLVEHVLPQLKKQERGKKQKRGQIAICASVAGYRGLPNGQPYGATKAALINFTESLKAEVGAQIDVKVINPGFVESRLTDKNDFYMPARISADKAGVYIARGLQKRSFEIDFPKRFTLFVRLMSFLPYGIYFRLFGQKKI